MNPLIQLHEQRDKKEVIIRSQPINGNDFSRNRVLLPRRLLNAIAGVPEVAARRREPRNLAEEVVFDAKTRVQVQIDSRVSPLQNNSDLRLRQKRTDDDRRAQYLVKVRYLELATVELYVFVYAVLNETPRVQSVP